MSEVSVKDAHLRSFCGRDVCGFPMGWLREVHMTYKLHRINCPLPRALPGHALFVDPFLVLHQTRPQNRILPHHAQFHLLSSV